MKTHLLFDFFGTLVEYSASRTDQGYARSHALLGDAGARLGYREFLDVWSAIAIRFEQAAESSRREFSMTELVTAFLGRIGLDAERALVDDFTRQYLAEWNKGVRYADALPEMLGRLDERYTLGIVTNTHDRDLVRDHLAAMGVGSRFACLVTSVEFGSRKPDPAIFHEALRRLGATSGGSLYVGDNHAADYLGARAAGIDCLLIDPGSAAPIPAADRLASLLALESRLEADSSGAMARRVPRL